jgi:fructose-1,6-bisphosphatase II / sedoheptulose-1,7-bisphosphatase
MNREVRSSQGAAALDRVLTLELVRVTEHAAVAAARLRGRGDEMAADRAAVEAMRRELNKLQIHGRVVIGEGERDEAPMLFIGEEVGSRRGPAVDIALDPLEGTTIAAKNLPNAIAVVAIAESGTLLNAPDVYMEKIAVGPGYPKDLVDLDRSPTENITALAQAKGVPLSEVTACVLDRPRHAKLIDEIRATGAAIRMIGDGDVAGIIDVTEPERTGIDIYMGIGGAPEGVLAASALRCTGGHMQGRLIISSEEQRERARRMGVSDANHKYDLHEMARGEVLFAATGVTDGDLLSGVKFGRRAITTHTLVMRSSSGTVRWIRAHHQDTEKFGTGEDSL